MRENPYELADKSAEILRKRAIKRFKKTQSRAALLDFDELSVIELFKGLYDDLDEDNKGIFMELAEMAYDEAKPHGQDEPDWTWVLALLDSYNAVTGYIYNHEVERKKEYTTEGVNSVKNRFLKKKAINKGMRYWDRFSSQYCDIVTDEATLKAYKDAGVKYVMWRTQNDEVVCSVCGPRDKKIYPIDKAPPKAHWGCRCWYESVLEKE